MAKTYDPKCYELAAHFLSDVPQLAEEGYREDLAAYIQQEIEDWILSERWDEGEHEGCGKDSQRAFEAMKFK